jgi:pentatricopeptide repeat protein
MQVYNQAIEGYFRMDKVDKAIDLFGTMMHENARADFALNEVPTPSSSTCTCVIAGWIHKNDIANAEKWFSMLLQQPLVEYPS